MWPSVASTSACQRAYNIGMHRPLLSAAFLLLAFSIPLSAQRGGMHASGGARGGTAAHGGSSGHMGGGRVSAGMRSGSAMAHRGFNRGSSFYASASSRGFNRFHDRRFRNFRLRNNCYGYGCRGFGYPWWYAGAFDPYWWWDSGSSYDEDRERDIALANQMNQQSLEEQRMRAPDPQEPYSRPDPPSQLPQSASAPLTPSTVLVFRDRHQQEVQNYAIVGQTLWNFAPQHTQKIPLSDLDLPATAKANDERGVDFRVPTPHEGE